MPVCVCVHVCVFHYACVHLCVHINLPFGSITTALSTAGLPTKYLVVPVNGYKPKLPQINHALIVPEQEKDDNRYYIRTRH